MRDASRADGGDFLQLILDRILSNNLDDPPSTIYRISREAQWVRYPLERLRRTLNSSWSSTLVMRLGSVLVPLIRLWISESLSKVGRGTLTEPRFSPSGGVTDLPPLTRSAGGRRSWPSPSVGAADSVPTILLPPYVGRSSAGALVPSVVCRSPRPGPLPVRARRPQSTASQGRAGGERQGGGALALALTAVLDCGSRTGGTSTVSLLV
jgi:hypothetical protein